MIDQVFFTIQSGMDFFWIIIFQLSKILYGISANLIAPFFLSEREQGIWFLILSFGSLFYLLINIFSQMLVIFIPHENKKIRNNTEISKKLYNFINFNLKFFILSFVILCFLTAYVFYYIESNNIWFTTYIIYLISLFFYGISFIGISLIEGIGKIRLSFILKSAYFLIVSIVIYLFVIKVNVFAISISNFIPSMIIIFLLIHFYKRKLGIYFSYIFGLRTRVLKDKKYWQFIIRNSVNMLSGFFLFQIYVPIVYKFKDEILAGKVGMSIAFFMAVFSLSTSIIHGKISYFSNLIANDMINVAYREYIKFFKISIMIFLILSLGGFMLIFLIFDNIKTRFVDLLPFIMLALSWGLQLLISNMIILFRIFKEEPFVMLTILSAFYILISTIIIIKYLPEEFIFIGFFSNYFFTFPLIYFKYRKFVEKLL